MILLAPFLGDYDVIEDVTAAGGLIQWSPDESAGKDYEIEAWSWLKNNALAEEPTPIMLDFGTSDRLASAFPVLTDTLDAEQVFAIEGDHGWETWSERWADISARIQ